MSDKALQSIQDVVRVPFYQYENNSRSYNLDSYYDQAIINLIPERMQDYPTETIKEQLAKRPGLYSDGTLDYLTGFVTDPTACTVRDFIPITALFDVFVVAVFDSSVNKFYLMQVRPITGTVTQIGSSISGSTGDNIYLTEISQSSAGSLLPACAVHWVKSDLTDSAGYWASTSGGTFDGVLHDITDTAFPANQTPALITTGRFVYQRGTFYIATLDGQIFNSYAGQNNINAWSNATSQIGSIQTNIYTDQLLGLERIKNNIIAFSRNSIEFFNEVGTSVNNPCTLAAIDQVFIKFGALKPDLIRNIDDVLYWVAYGTDGQSGLWKLDGYTPIKISTPLIDSLIIANAADLNSYRFNLQTCIMNGKRQLFINSLVIHTMVYNTDSNSFSIDDTYTINSLGDGRTCAMVYNVDDKTWWGFNYNSNIDTVVRFATSFASPAQGELYTQFCILDTLGFETLFIYKIRQDNIFSDDVGTDIIAPVMAYAQLNPLWFENEKRKRVSKLKIITNTIPLQDSGDTADYSLYVLYRKDNLATSNGSGFFNTIVRRIENPQPQGRFTVNNLGMARVWNFAVLDKSRMNLRLHALELDIQQGSH